MSMADKHAQFHGEAVSRSAYACVHAFAISLTMRMKRAAANKQQKMTRERLRDPADTMYSVPCSKTHSREHTSAIEHSGNDCSKDAAQGRL